LEQLSAWLLSCWLHKSSKERPTTADDIAPDELIEFSAIAALAHLVEPRCKDAAIPGCCPSRILERRWRTTPTLGFGDLARLSWRDAKRRGANVHDLTLCARGNEAQLCNAATDQRNTRAVWCTLRERTQERQTLGRFCKCICIVNDEDEFAVRCGEISKKCGRTYCSRLALSNRSGEAWKSHAIILIGGKMKSITQVATGTQPPHWSISANAPRGDGAALPIPSTTADQCESSVGERIQCSVNAWSS
jgi:hypothetical protein